MRTTPSCGQARLEPVLYGLVILNPPRAIGTGVSSGLETSRDFQKFFGTLGNFLSFIFEILFPFLGLDLG